MFDKVQVVFWIITYVLMIIFSQKNYRVKAKTIPLLSVLLNIAWKFVALNQSRGYWAHILWFMLDVVIYANAIRLIPNMKWRVQYVIMTLLTVLMLNCVFKIGEGMLISCFIIDLIMAGNFYAERKSIFQEGKVVIGTTRLFGDLAAAIFYAPKSLIVFVIGICVFVLNSQYLFYCISEKRYFGQKRGQHTEATYE